MYWSILLASSAGFLSAFIFSILFTSRIRSRLFTCECDLADLQDRHLRTVRRDAAKSRWDNEEQLDGKIEASLQQPPKAKGWTKWPSSAPSENSSAT